MRTRSLTTVQAAEILGVGASSVKRWAEKGVIPCVRTPGGHRRFALADVEKMAASFFTAEQQLEAWFELLLNLSMVPLRDALLRTRRQHYSWLGAADVLSPILAEVGSRWARGELTIQEEHLASENLSRALSHICVDIEVSSDARRALLLTAEKEQHTLGLSLLEPCLREKNILPVWSGNNTPLASVNQVVNEKKVEIVCVSASISSDMSALASYAESLQALCQPLGVDLILGGQGPWPTELEFAKRVMTFQEIALLAL